LISFQQHYFCVFAQFHNFLYLKDKVKLETRQDNRNTISISLCLANAYKGSMFSSIKNSVGVYFFFGVFLLLTVFLEATFFFFVFVISSPQQYRGINRPLAFPDTTNLLPHFLHS